MSKKGIGTLFIGMLMMVVGLILLGTVVTTGVTATTTTGIDSFTGTVEVLRLAPLVFAAIVIGGGVALVGFSLAGFAGKGPLSG